MFKYFQGSSVHGKVHGSGAKNFTDVVARLQIPPPLGLSRATFLALPKKERNERKQVPYFVAACFQSSPSDRLTEQATHCNLLFIDVDEDEATGKCPAAPFVGNPENLFSALGDFNFAAHTTASSTPQKPRMRIIIDAENISVADYPRAVRTIAALLGLPVLTPESKKATQPMFLPCVFSDSTDEDHPLIAHRTDGRTFTAKDISDSLPDEYKKERVQDTSDDLDFLRAPIPEITLKVAREALFTINPDCGYAEWLENAAALRHQFSPDQAEEAYALFDEWSETGSKYGSSEETRAKWDSLRPTPNGRAPVTIRSLIRQAVAAGWSDKKIKEQSREAFGIWAESVENLGELMSEGIQRIVAVPTQSSWEEKSMIECLRRTAKERFREPTTVKDIREDIERLRTKISQQNKTESPREPKWVKGICYVQKTQEFYRQRTGESYPTKAFDQSYSRNLTDPEDELGRPNVLPSDYALNKIKVPVVYDFEYQPSQPNEMFFVRDERRYVNTYSPTYPQPDEARAEQAGAMFMRHMGNLIAEPAYQRTVIDFLAFMVQNPGVKVRWAVFIQSEEGAGKTFIPQAMKAVLGERHVRSVSNETIKKGWNEWSVGSQLVAIEEIRAVGTSRHEIMNVLKQLITNSTMSVDQRNRDTREASNCTNYLVFSNFQNALAITPGNRRYFVIKSPLQSPAAIAALGENYFPPLFKMLEEMPGALRSWFLDWEISPDFKPNGPPPHTIYEKQMMEDSTTELHSAVRKLVLEADYPLVQYDIVSLDALLQALVSKSIYKTSEQALQAVLREEGFQQHGGRVSIGDTPHYLWTRGEIKDAVAMATHRERKGLKNLGMELMY